MQKDFVNPRVTVHVTTGNGGPPSADNFCEDPSLPSCRLASTRNQTAAFGYGRLTVHNATHLTYEQFNNGDGRLWDRFTVVQQQHGPFPPHGPDVQHLPRSQ
eukprot:COSAG01_NODE_12950_length_1658_cov_1.843489_3_plen_102_part_00